MLGPHPKSGNVIKPKTDRDPLDQIGSVSVRYLPSSLVSMSALYDTVWLNAPQGILPVT
jgi:hypothetical protein